MEHTQEQVNELLKEIEAHPEDYFMAATVLAAEVRRLREIMHHREIGAAQGAAEARKCIERLQSTIEHRDLENEAEAALDAQEKAKLREELAQWKTTAERDRAENVDMRAQLAEKDDEIKHLRSRIGDDNERDEALQEICDAVGLGNTVPLREIVGIVRNQREVSERYRLATLAQDAQLAEKGEEINRARKAWLGDDYGHMSLLEAMQKFRCDVERDRAEKDDEIERLSASLADERQMVFASLALVGRIRAAVGDPEGKLMQDQLVEYCRKLAADASRLPGEQT